jgi:hypothetical protein
MTEKDLGEIDRSQDVYRSARNYTYPSKRFCDLTAFFAHEGRMP